MYRVTSIAFLSLLTACHFGNSNGTLRAAGYVEATDVRISTKVPGRIDRLLHEEGDRVQAGEVMAHIDTVDLELALTTMKAERDQFLAEFKGAKQDYDRLETLFKSGSATQKARDDTKTRLDVLDGRLNGVLGRIAQLEQNIKDSTIVSPIAGVITNKLVEKGELLGVGATLLVVTDLGDAWLTAYIPEPDLGRVRLGQEAEVKTDGGESRTGKVTFISSTAEFTPKNVQTRDERVKLVFKIKISLANTDGLFKVGMPAEAWIQTTQGKR